MNFTFCKNCGHFFNEKDICFITHFKLNVKHEKNNYRIYLNYTNIKKIPCSRSKPIIFLHKWRWRILFYRKKYKIDSAEKYTYSAILDE